MKTGYFDDWIDQQVITMQALLDWNWIEIVLVVLILQVTSDWRHGSTRIYGNVSTTSTARTSVQVSTKLPTALAGSTPWGTRVLSTLWPLFTRTASTCLFRSKPRNAFRYVTTTLLPWDPSLLSRIPTSEVSLKSDNININCYNNSVKQGCRKTDPQK